jgi:hypothetical protein
MNFAEFVLLVAQMRKAQIDYFAGRAQSKLIEAKQAEKAVDQFIEQFNRDFEEIVREEQAQLPTNFKPKVHTPPLVHPFDQEEP